MWQIDLAGLALEQCSTVRNGMNSEYRMYKYKMRKVEIYNGHVLSSLDLENSHEGGRIWYQNKPEVIHL